MCVENEEKNNFNFTTKVINGQDVLILGGLNMRNFTGFYIKKFHKIWAKIAKTSYDLHELDKFQAEKIKSGFQAYFFLGNSFVQLFFQLGGVVHYDVCQWKG